ncbi:MAG TPA: LysR family transcriptional regulator [Actinocatenispora sp.]
MEIRQLRYFLVVADELHFGRAAERLSIAQSAVSQQVRRLERELGVTLLDRTTRTVRLTDAGRRLVPYAERVLTDVDAARAALDDLRTERTGTVRLGTATGLGGRLDAILEHFARLAPHARLDLVTAPAADRVRRVRSGELDAALLRGEHHDTGLELLPLWRDPLVAALPARHPLAVRAAVDLADLAGLPLRIPSRARNPQLHDEVLARCAEAGSSPVLGPESTTDQDTLAAIGFGTPSWTVYYAPKAEQISAPGVVFRPLRPEPALHTYLAVRPDPPRAELRALVDACAR